MNAALDSEILHELVKCFSENDNTIRELASRAVIKVACTEKGRTKLVQDGIVEDVKKLFNDNVVQIRSNAYKILINVAEFTEGIDQVINCNVIPILIDKLVNEKNQ